MHKLTIADLQDIKDRNRATFTLRKISGNAVISIGSLRTVPLRCSGTRR